MTADRGAPPRGGALRYRLRGALELFFATDDNAYLLRGGGGAEHVIRRPNDSDRLLLQRLAEGGVDVVPGSPTCERLAPLIQAGAVVVVASTEGLVAEDAGRFARQLPYLEDFGDPVDAQRTLRSSCVAILGCGGLGTWTLAALASCGVGRFVLVDDDTVDVSNLNRQILFAAAQVGASKVAVAEAWVRAFDPAIEVTALRRRITAPGDLGWVRDCDCVVLTADDPPYELNRWVNAACVRDGVPFIAAGQQPPLIKIGPMFVPGEGACFACHERRLRREFPLYDELAEHRLRKRPSATTLGPSSGLIGTLLALEVMHLLLGHRPVATQDRVLLIDMRTLTTRWEEIERDPVCETCATR